MAQEMVKLAFIFLIVFNSPSDVIKAEIVENRDLKPLLEVGIVMATNENEQAPSQRYRPFIQKPIFSSRDAPLRGLKTCSYSIDVDSCNDCDRECNRLSFEYGKCEGIWPFRESTKDLQCNVDSTSKASAC